MFRALIPVAIEENIRVAIVTFSGQVDLIRTVLDDIMNTSQNTQKHGVVDSDSWWPSASLGVFWRGESGGKTGTHCKCSRRIGTITGHSDSKRNDSIN
mmetsp:Transcript_18838/g.27091  ORF Transcript_18838/g.27091 Transcript_18838/m.27091 type:complete len:98 (+) Transcript_18838:196-489(+)